MNMSNMSSEYSWMVSIRTPFKLKTFQIKLQNQGLVLFFNKDYSACSWESNCDKKWLILDCYMWLLQDFMLSNILCVKKYLFTLKTMLINQKLLILWEFFTLHYRQFHEALGTWLHGRLLFSTNHSAWYRSLKEFDWIKKVTGHEAMCQRLPETACLTCVRIAWTKISLSLKVFSQPVQANQY